MFWCGVYKQSMIAGIHLDNNSMTIARLELVFFFFFYLFLLQVFFLSVAQFYTEDDNPWWCTMCKTSIYVCRNITTSTCRKYLPTHYTAGADAKNFLGSQDANNYYYYYFHMYLFSTYPSGRSNSSLSPCNSR